MERLEEIKNYMSSMRDLSLLKTWGDNREATAFYTTVALPIGVSVIPLQLDQNLRCLSG